MCFLKQKFLQYFWRCALVVLLGLSVYGGSIGEAQALLRQHHDTPGVLRYHSQVSIPDEKGYAQARITF